MQDYGSDTYANNRQHKREQILTVETKHGVQTIHKWGKRNPGTSRKV